MSLGASFLLTSDQTAALLSLDDDHARVEWLEALEEEIEDSDWLELDKAWDALHRCLGDGTLVINDEGPPLSHAVFGSVPLMEDDDTDVFAGLLPADEAPVVAAALAAHDHETLRTRYWGLADTDYQQPLSDDDLTYTLDALNELRAFVDRAARTGRAIVFTVAG